MDDILRQEFNAGRELFLQEKYDEAEEIFRHVVEDFKRNRRADNKRDRRRDRKATLESKFWFGVTLSEQEKYDEAEKLLQQVVQGRDKSPGPDHKDTLWSKYYLGRTLLDQGKYNKAEQIVQQIVQREGTVDQNYNGMGEAKYKLGRIYYEQEKYIEGEDMLRQAARELEKSNGRDNSETLGAKDLLLATLRKLGEDSEAEKMLSDVVPRMESMKVIVDEDHEDTSKPLDLPQALDTDGPLLSSTEATAHQGLTGLLDSYFPNEHQDPEPYTDLTIRKISMLLEMFNIRWSKLPRTYIILRIIGYPDLLDRLIDFGFSDYWFPIGEQDLQDCLEPPIRAAFVNTQGLVCTNLLDLELGQGGQHCYFKQGEPLPFDYKAILGTGGYGRVHKVVSHTTSKEYALKRVHRNTASTGWQESAITQFISEIEILKRLRHRHIVKFVGSYTDLDYVGLLMSPVADMNLKDYLGRVAPSKYPELRTFCGCLATALEFLHARKIRHKDIKPSNILVNHGNVLFTDFGLSLDFEDADGSTTTGIDNGRTPRYCAPEVAELESRNTKSDVWSLGVVFVEMTVVLKGRTIQDMDEFFEGHGSGRKYIRTNPAAFKEFTTELEGIGESTDNRALDWAAQMLVVEQQKRPTASELVTSITSPGEEGEGSEFCGICCVSADAEVDEFWD
ncbi:uncharacterized protein N0V89_007820 [Didymosphaeria variabile]|uniref:Protein kinase domain-containing protein n=1 Tax=Didymosphaeria variabile TaxID=1932322 RepID=A0A9W8XKB1_9PLEO|nr:uncharacterized protein N0V89_007820 [Didymosphaeria variabile]KAJ4352472.1 hypothetical protein N0V89_007820 [Didymosphaeria variabile]